MSAYLKIAFVAVFLIFGIVQSAGLLWNLYLEGWNWNAASKPPIYGGESPGDEELRLPYWKAIFAPLAFIIPSSVALVFLL